MITHHLSDALLAEYAAGNLGEAGRLWVVSHLSLCEKCRDDLLTWEAVGGALLEQQPAAAPEAVPAGLWARLDAPPPPPPPPIVEGDPLLPQPLRSVMGPRAAWRWIPAWPGIWKTYVPVGPPGTRLLIYDFAPGVKVPRHAHEGPECTLVLHGACHDERGRYGKGDVVLVDDHAHTLEIEEEGCLVLQWNVGPLLLDNPVLALINKIIRA